MLSVVEPLSNDAALVARSEGVRDPAGSYDRQIVEKMRERFSTIEQEAERFGIKVDMLHEIDQSPAEAIVRVAKLRGCDLIVMASHGRRGLRRMMLGSQTSEVVASTDVPVLVIR